jgi:uncharacterized protein YbjT (DUF2867 family)
MIRFLTALAIVFASSGAPLFADGVLVFGGTGQLGAYHVQLLAKQGETVTVFHRPTSSFERLEGLEYHRVSGDLLDPHAVVAAMEQVKPRVVIDTSARRGGRLRAEDPFYAEAMNNIVRAAVAANSVEQIIIHSSVGVRESAPMVKRDYGYNTDNPNMRDKAKAEVLLEQSGIPYTIIRNGLLEYEPVAATGNGRLTEDEATFGRITRADLAGLTLTCIDNDVCLGKILHAVDDTLTGPRPRPEASE